MIDPTDIIRSLVADRKAELKIYSNRKQVGANDSEKIENIISPTKNKIHIELQEIIDAEDETSIKFEKFVNRAPSGNSTVKHDRITSAVERIKYITAEVEPIRRLGIQFTNSSGSEKWATHTWIGVEMRKDDYRRFIWNKFVKKILPDAGEPEI